MSDNGRDSNDVIQSDSVDVYTQDFTDVFAKELESLEARRKAAGLEHAGLRSQEHLEPAVDRGITGMAISGGGIRSSTFSLGVVQTLQEADVFRRLDYISTVSGGGYTGAMLSSLLHEPDSSTGEFPLTKPKGKPEPHALQHVRNCANYLDAGGLLGSLRMPAVFIRGLLLNFLLFLPFIMLAVLLTELVHEVGVDVLWHLSQRMSSSSWGFLGQDNQSLLFMIPVMVAVYGGVTGIGARNWSQRDRREAWTTFAIFLFFAVLVLISIGMVVNFAIETPLYGEFGLVGYLEEWWSIRGWSLIVGAVALVKGLQASATFFKIAKKLSIVLAAIAGPAAIFGLYLLLCIAQLDSPFMNVEPVDELQTTVSSSTFPTDSHAPVTPALARALAVKGIDYRGMGEVSAAYCVDEGIWMIPKENELGCPLQELCGIADSDVEESCGYRLRPRGDHVVVIGAKLRLGGEASDQTLLSDTAFAILMLLLFVFNYFFIDVNASSLHGFYRDRLSRLYLIRLRDDGTAEGNDALKLTYLSQNGSSAPYHLLNATLNLQGNQYQSARGRQSSVFFFSKHFCGSVETGYCDTGTLERWDPHLDLGTAMAISAAAASPNMGSMTLKPIVFVMTLLNVRLGYWLPNPLYVGTRRKPARQRLRPRTRYLMREALGALDTKHWLVNVSDGGHLENLGAYGLLRRKCRVLIIVDGEADPCMEFRGLVTLMRFARIDLGIEIDIDLAQLRLNEAGYSGAHCAFGTIDYGSVDGVPQIGHLVYIKSSLTGDEDECLARYRAECPTFPHESTADQFFDEAQFEAYRALGARVASILVQDPRLEEVLAAMAAPAA